MDWVHSDYESIVKQWIYYPISFGFLDGILSYSEAASSNLGIHAQRNNSRYWTVSK
jgi:hypothetical protein